jgi:uncharacterized delta-60 repeat protein
MSRTLGAALLVVALVANAAAFAADDNSSDPDKNHFILCTKNTAVCSTDFGYGGFVAKDFHENVKLVMPDGRVLHAGSYARSGDAWPYMYSFAVSRRHADGSYDTTFNGTGTAIVPIFHSYEFAFALALQPDGKILVGGIAFDPAHPGPDCYPAFCWNFPTIVRLNPNGTLDRSFNGTGKVILTIGDLNTSGDIEDDAAMFGGLELDPEGRITIFGYKKQFATARINPDGTVDASFQTTGPSAREYVPDAILVGEAYNPTLDHYFITWVPQEIAALQAADVIRGWTLTGRTFKAYAAPRPGTSPVCRFYVPPAQGNSHFFGRGTEECKATALRNPGFVLEDAAFMQMYLPVDGACPDNTVEVYRVFDNRPDINHRYITDKSLRDSMVAKGWIAEGEGTNTVTMCAPQ